MAMLPTTICSFGNNGKKICKDSRIWGQNNREAGSHLGVLKKPYIRKGFNLNSKGRPFKEGYKHSKESRIKMSKVRQGKNHPGWKGSDVKYFKKLALLRDNFTCQTCGYKNEEFKRSALDVDHKLSIKKFPQLKLELDNLITLCPNCHRIKTLREKDYKKGD